MAIRQLLNAPAQSTVALAITNVQTSVTVASAAGFGSILAGGGQLSVVILDSGNPAFNAGNPFATPWEYQPVNGIAGNVLTFGLGGGGAARAAFAGTTPSAYFAGATVAAALIADDLTSSAPWKIFEQVVTSGTIASFAPANIPQTYRELEIDWGAITDQATGQNLLMRCNGDSTANYNWITSDNSLAGGAAFTTVGNLVTSIRIGTAGTNIASGRFVIQNYAFSLAAASMRQFTGMWTQDSDSTMKGGSVWGEWKNSANALTSLSIFPAAGLLKVGSWLRIRATP